MAEQRGEGEGEGQPVQLQEVPVQEEVLRMFQLWKGVRGSLQMRRVLKPNGQLTAAFEVILLIEV